MHIQHNQGRIASRGHVMLNASRVDRAVKSIIVTKNITFRYQFFVVYGYITGIDVIIVHQFSAQSCGPDVRREHLVVVSQMQTRPDRTRWTKVPMIATSEGHVRGSTQPAKLQLPLLCLYT